MADDLTRAITVEARAEQAEQECERLRATISALEGRLAQQQGYALEIQALYDAACDDLCLLSGADETAESLATECERLRARVAELENAAAELRSVIAEMHAEIGGLVEQEAQQLHDIAELCRERAKLRARVAEARAEASDAD